MTTLATRPNPTGARQQAAVPSVLVRPGETQAQFAVRYHSTMARYIPETERRNAEMFQKWRDGGEDGSLESRAIARFPESEFVRVRDVPVFAEHTTKDREGRPVVYDRAALQLVADRCNERILDTGDFPPITEGHTPSADELSAGRKQPDVLGYAGPFRIGQIGNRNPRWAIFCDEFHHKADRPRLMKLQRRSPEVWLEERMEDRFMDPIAALGAETPRLDLGMSRFCRTASGKLIEKYSAVAPGPYSTFLPGDDDARQDKKRYESKDSAVDQPNVDEALIQKIVSAFMQTAPMQWVVGQMEKEKGAGDVPDEGPEANGPDAAGMPPTPPADAPPLAPPPGEPEPSAAPDAGDASEPGDKAPPEPEAGAGDDEGDDEPYEPDEEDREQVRRYMGGECSDEEFQQYAAGKRRRIHSRRRRRYGAEEAEMTDVPEEDDMPTATEPDKFSRQEQRLEKARYARIEAENKALKDRLDKLEARNAQSDSDRRKTDRYSKLSELSRHYQFDPKKEAARTEKLDDEQFENHLDAITENYQRIPVGQRLYVPSEIEPTRYSRDSEGPQKGRASASESEAAIALATKYQREGKAVSFDDALREVRESAKKETAKVV